MECDGTSYLVKKVENKFVLACQLYSHELLKQNIYVPKQETPKFNHKILNPNGWTNNDNPAKDTNDWEQK